MPVPSLNVVEGEDIVSLLDSLEKQRKELMWLLENLDTTNVNELNAKVINAGIINGERLFIDSTVTFAEGYDTAGLRQEVKTKFEVSDGLIAGKVNVDTFNALGELVGQNASAITQTAKSIRSEVSESVKDLDGRITGAYSAITQTAKDIELRVTYDDYTGSQITSRINLDPYAVSIQASKINLIGAVNVLSDITGNLGRITTGNIDIYENIYLGNSIHMRGGGTGVYFGSDSQIFDNGGNLQIEGSYRTTIVGTVDFTYASVIGLSDGGNGTTVRYSAASKRLYIDVNGKQVAYVDAV